MEDLRQEPAVYNNVMTYNHPVEDECVTSTLRNLVEFFEPGAVHSWDEIDAMLPHERNAGVEATDLMACLLGRGYSVEYTVLFDDERFFAEGLSYLEEYYGIHGDSPKWDPENFYNQWTPAMVADSQQQTTAAMGSLMQSAEFTARQAEPTLDLVRQHLAEGASTGSNTLVHITLSADDGAEGTHSVLVTGFLYAADGTRLYSVAEPNTGVGMPDGVITQYTESDLLAAFMPEEGIFAVSKKI
jgi:hypothetical protein